MITLHPLYILISCSIFNWFANMPIAWLQALIIPSYIHQVAMWDGIRSCGYCVISYWEKDVAKLSSQRFKPLELRTEFVNERFKCMLIHTSSLDGRVCFKRTKLEAHSAGRCFGWSTHFYQAQLIGASNLSSNSEMHIQRKRQNKGSRSCLQA